MFRTSDFVRWGIAVLVCMVLTPSAFGEIAVLVPDLSGDPVMYPSFVTEYDGLLYFRGSSYPGGTNAELWRSNGVQSELVADIYPGTTGSSPYDLAVYNGLLLLGANGTTGGNKLWQYDGATDVASLAPGSTSGASLPSEMTAYNGNLYFRAFKSGYGSELWTYDGTDQTMIEMYSGSGSSYPQHFIEYNGLLYFNANGTPGQGTELWSYSGTGMPVEAARIYDGNGSSPENFCVYDGRLYFSAYDGVHGRELWRYDSTTGTAELAADIVPGGQYDSSNPNGLAVYDGKLYFSADDGVHGYELWSFDGTNAEMVAEINPTPDPGNGDTFLMDSSPADLTVLGGKLYFSADDGSHGRELWSFDGTDVAMVLDINPGQYGSEVSELTVYHNSLFFSADNGYVPGLYNLQQKLYVLTVPEPSVVLLALLALAGLFAAARFRR